MSSRLFFFVLKSNPIADSTNARFYISLLVSHHSYACVSFSELMLDTFLMKIKFLNVLP